MLRPVLTALIALPLVLPVTTAFADSHRKHAALRQAPPKDCTRFNGRVGYYGNPWCTRAEQERWDRWEASRITRR